MLSKCANPTCSNTFRYLHEGKLYLINSASCCYGRKRIAIPANKSGVPEYAWLCSVCCRYLTMRLNEEGGTIAVLSYLELSRENQYALTTSVMR